MILNITEKHIHVATQICKNSTTYVKNPVEIALNEMFKKPDSARTVILSNSLKEFRNNFVNFIYNSVFGYSIYTYNIVVPGEFEFSMKEAIPRLIEVNPYGTFNFGTVSSMNINFDTYNFMVNYNNSNVEYQP